MTARAPCMKAAANQPPPSSHQKPRATATCSPASQHTPEAEKSLDFNLDGRKVTPAMYAEVANAIKAKKIAVMVDPNLAVAAAYSPEIRVNDKTTLYDVM